jgi:hypothetical protein
MARYISMHTLACLTRQGADALVTKLQAAEAVRARRVLLNMQEGKMLVEFEAAGALRGRNSKFENRNSRRTTERIHAAPGRRVGPAGK